MNALAAFPACAPSTGTRNFVTSEDSGSTWSLYTIDSRAVAFQVCVDAATATRAASWGSLKILDR